MIDQNIANILTQLRENNNPKKELNHIYVDSENIVVTDTRILIVHKHNMDIKDDFLLLNQKCKINMDFNIEDGFMEFGVDVYRKKILLREKPKTGNGYFYNYPDYKRIIPKIDSKKFSHHLKGVDALYTLTSQNGVVLDYVKFATLFRKLDKIRFDRYYFSEKNMPIAIENDNLMIVLMPLVIG
ncbi:MAG: hypothetical protein E3J96_01405 [Sulfurovum sp.]|nr:MAG: hypothetical protein E3J96_01405 [Sulfurovum sp.]